MNNCPKCGNPLQEGVSNCPICGTNILEEQNVAVAPSPVAEAPQAPVEPAPAPAAPAAPAEPAPAPVAPVAPAPVAEPTSPATEAPAQPTEPVTVGAIAPTVERIESSTPVPSIPSSIASPVVSINDNEPIVANPNLKPKNNKKTVLVLVLVLVVALGIGCFMFLSPSKSKNKAGGNKANNTEVSLSDMASNGYHLKIAEGWELNEDGNNVILTNSESTVAIKLEHSNANLNTIDANGIEEILSQNENYKDVEVTSVDVSGRNAFLIAATINNYPVQIYFINGGSNLVLGATIVYQSNDTKTKYEATITEMIGTLSYSEASVKAIETVSQYSQMFGVFNNIIYNMPEPTEEYNIPDAPEPPEEPEEPESPEDPEAPVDQPGNPEEPEEIE